MVKANLLGIVKLRDNLRVAGEILTECTQEHGGRHLARLVNANDQNVLLGNIDFNP